MNNADTVAYIGEFCKRYGYPAEAEEALVKAGRAILGHPRAAEIFRRNQRDFLAGAFQNGREVLEPLGEAAELTGVHLYTVHLVYYICLARPVEELYRQRGISPDIYRDSMLDLKWKLLECRRMYGIWGSFVADWFYGFFRMTRFALGRLQYERVPFGREYRGPAASLSPDSPVLNMHIPSCGPLTMEACMASFKKAYAFYRKGFQEGPVPFACSSWLLFPEHERMLPETSHIRRFLSCFEILDWGEDPDGGDLWRIFGPDWDREPGSLPRNTGLQRAYADWLETGHRPGWGLGLFFFDGEGILTV